LASNFFCGLFSRTAIGELTIIQQPIRNLGSLKTSGLDFAMNLRVPADFLSWGGKDGRISVNSNVNYLLDYKVRTFATSPELQYAGTISADATQSFPKWRGLTSLVIQSGPVSLTGTWRYTRKMRDRTFAVNPATTVEGTPNYSYFDLNARAEIGDRFELFGGITNIGNKAPPVVGGTAAVTNLGTYDAIGRTFFAGLRARF
jgi:outer membrane receptor protein involved in Fe transport